MVFLYRGVGWPFRRTSKQVSSSLMPLADLHAEVLRTDLHAVGVGHPAEPDAQICTKRPVVSSTGPQAGEMICGDSARKRDSPGGRAEGYRGRP